MSEQSPRVILGINFPAALALAFITLKLCGMIDWSWWWVLAPLWGPVALVLAVAAALGLACLALLAAAAVIDLVASLRKVKRGPQETRALPR